MTAGCHHACSMMCSRAIVSRHWPLHTCPRPATPGSPKAGRMRNGLPLLRSSEPSNGQVANKRSKKSPTPAPRVLSNLRRTSFPYLVQECVALLPMLSENVRTRVERVRQCRELPSILRGDSSRAKGGRPSALPRPWSLELPVMLWPRHPSGSPTPGQDRGRSPRVSP